jgi:arsenate reductase
MKSQSPLPRVLFLCTGNSCRSQMAEGFARSLHGDRLLAESAGIVAKGLDPLAVRVMAETGVDISSQQSKTPTALGSQTFDLVITVCSDAERNCPVFHAATRKLHRGFDDPPRLAIGARSEEEALTHYRRVRDEIRQFVLTLPQLLKGDTSGAKG